MTGCTNHADLVARFPSFLSTGPDFTSAMGEILGQHIYGGLLILMYGDLGAGKTHLAKAIGGALGTDSVKSPSFAIETRHRLPGRDFEFVHADLYRLEDASYVAPQFEEYLDDGHIVAVEWAERWKNPPTLGRWDIFIESGADDSRLFAFSAYGDKALAKLSEAYLEMMDICR